MSEQAEKLAKFKAEAEEQLKAAGESNIDDALRLAPELAAGEMERVMHELHSG